MPTPSHRTNIEFYRKQAKVLLRAARSGDPAALARLAGVPDPSPTLSLHDAQWTIAREQGFKSWARFKASVEQANRDFEAQAAAFVQTAIGDAERARDLLKQNPEIAEGGLYPALVLGDSEAVVKMLDAAPTLVSTKGGPADWEPLLYVCFSRFAQGKSERAAAMARTAGELLEKGADPNGFYIDKQWPDNPLPCLYGATGLNNNPALARLLLAAGAKPDDNESLYHSTEHPDHECLKLLIEYGARPQGTNALKHQLDREDLEGLRLLLDAGADPNETNDEDETALHWAVWRGRSARIVEMLLDKGATIDAKRKDGRTAYALALRSGQTETVSLLRIRGADMETSPLDAFVGAFAIAEPTDLPRILADYPDIVADLGEEASRLVPSLATCHRTDAVRNLLEIGAPVDGRMDAGGTALHWACWQGYPDLVEVLLKYGASLTIEDESFHATPPGWFTHGLQNCPGSSGDYPAVARLLIAAGARFPEWRLPTGNEEVDAVLREGGAME